VSDQLRSSPAILRSPTWSSTRDISLSSLSELLKRRQTSQSCRGTVRAINDLTAKDPGEGVRERNRAESLVLSTWQELATPMLGFPRMMSHRQRLFQVSSQHRNMVPVTASSQERSFLMPPRGRTPPSASRMEGHRSATSMFLAASALHTTSFTLASLVIEDRLRYLGKSMHEVRHWQLSFRESHAVRRSQSRRCRIDKPPADRRDGRRFHACVTASHAIEAETSRYHVQPASKATLSKHDAGTPLHSSPANSTRRAICGSGACYVPELAAACGVSGLPPRQFHKELLVLSGTPARS